MDKIVALCKNRGYVYPGSEIYGGLANSWDYGPLGVEFKNNVKKAWLKKFVQESPYNVGLDAAIIMNPQTWVTTGHVSSFSDPLLDCRACKARHRADKLIGEEHHEVNVDAMSFDEMDEFIASHEDIVCPVCGKPLDMDSATVGARRQEVDIPLPIEAKVIDHLMMQVKCSCGHCCKGQFPETVNAPVNFGPNITALVSYLSTYQNVPFKRLTHLLETIFGLHVSEGSVSNMLNSMRKFSKEPYEMIRQKVASGKVAGADETGININGRNNWLWTFQNDVATYLAFDGSRSHGAITDNFTPKELGGKVWVTDRWPAYFMGDVGMEDHQICIAHLLRNLTYTMQAFPDDDWSLDMLDLLRDSVHHRNQGDIGPEVRTKMEKRLDELLARPPIYTKTDGSDTDLDKLKKGIAKHRDYIFTFLTNLAVPPTNNDSEKALRPAKTKLKVSGCFRTEAGAQNYATVASVIQTAVKNGQNPFEVLRVIATLALA